MCPKQAGGQNGSCASFRHSLLSSCLLHIGSLVPSVPVHMQLRSQFPERQNQRSHALVLASRVGSTFEHLSE